MTTAFIFGLLIALMLTGMPISSSRSSFEIARTSSSVMPLTMSVNIEAEAILTAQPLPVKAISVTTLSVTRRSMRIWSPQSGLVSSAV